jgi:hypothetical protein
MSYIGSEQKINMNKFKMELVWHNCKNYPPSEFENNDLIATNGKDVYGMSWHKAEGYWIAMDDIVCRLDYSTLDKWWWADITQTVREEVKFRELLGEEDDS